MRSTDGPPGIVESSRFWRYGVAVLSMVVAVPVRLALDPVVGSANVLFAFTLAVMVSAGIGGRGPGLLASALSVPLAWYFFLEPRYSFAIESRVGVGSLVVLAASGVGISLLIGRPAGAGPPRTATWTRAPFFRRMALFAIAFLVLVMLTRLLNSEIALEKDRRQWVTHSYQVLNAIQALTLNLQAAETGQRGYLLTGDASYREPFESALRDEQAARRTLRQLTADNPRQQAKLDALDRLVEAKFSELQNSMALVRRQGKEAALAVVRTGEGKRVMEECRGLLSAMEAEDRRLLAERTQAAEMESSRVRWVLGLGSGGLLMLFVISGAVIERDSRNLEEARQAAGQAQERLRMALDAAKAGSWEWDLETDENVWSEGLWKLYGLEPHSLQPSFDAWWEVVHPDDRARTEQAVTEAARAGSELTVEFRVSGRDGGSRWLMAQGRLLRVGKPGKGRYVGIVLDITSRKRAEEALQERERDLRQFAEFAPVAIAMFDREMRYLAASRRFRDDFQLGDRELVGRSHYEIFPEIDEHWREIHRRCLAGAVERHPGERLARSDGSEQWIRWEIQPWHQSDGGIGGIILFSEEITGQRQSEQALLESAARLRLAQQVARIATFEWNIQTGVTTWTPELRGMYGLPPADSGGTPPAWQDLVHPEDREQTTRELQRAVESGRFDAEWRVVCPDGTLRWLAGRALFFKDDAGNPERLVGALIDVTEARQRDEALRRTEAELTEAQRVAHLGSWHWDARTDTVTGSKEIYNILGLDPALPFPGFRQQEGLYTPESWNQLTAARKAAEQTGAGYEMDLELARADGTHIWVTTRGEAVHDAAGQIVGLHCTLQEVTRRKRAEDEILARSTVIHAINRVFTEALACETEAALGRACLAIAEALTGSRFGFIGEINKEGRLSAIAISHPGWDAGRIAAVARERLRAGKGFFANDSPSDAGGMGAVEMGALEMGALDVSALEGQPPLRAFLGVPLIQAGEMFGMIGLCNREEGYTERELEAMGSLAPAIVQAFLGRRAEEALRESEGQFRTLANAMPQLCWIANADGWIFWYNQRWYEYTGTTPAQMEGWGWQSVHDPAALPKVLERWQVTIATGNPFDMVFPLRGADGAFRPFLTRVMPVRDRDGKVVRWFGTNTDIGEQQMKEEALRQAFEQRRMALEAAELGAWDYRFERGEVFWDDVCRNMFGLTSGSRIDYDEALSRIHPEDRPAAQEAVTQALSGDGDGVYHREFRVVWPDGSVHWIASHGRARFDEGRPVQFSGVSMDITERKQAELEIRLLNAQLEHRVRQRTAQLETANRELEAFAYSVSHDLRAPLRGIDGWSLALAEDYAGRLDERAHTYIDRVRSETQRMGLLIDDMLQLSRVTRSEMQVASVDLTALAGSIACGLAEANLDRRIEFAIEPGMKGTGDARLLEIALTNLMANAVKFTATRAAAHIEFGRTSRQDQQAFYVRDNGVGLDMEYADRLFRAFSRLHKASEFPGTGVGLATVQRIIHRHGGEVSVEAEIDRGATFYFTLGETD